ncbi:MAG: lytic transglycosylase domain-containing protein [Phycisphaerales bacterium]|nr:lytic transglycosylase domain-containing protein [Hyphomonadaceae bacterium]
MRFISAIIAVFVVVGAAHAQVLELGVDGAVTRHDGPAVYIGERVVPLVRATPPSAHRSPPSSSTMDALTNAAERAELSAALIEAVAWQESRLRPRVVSPAGAIGEMQLMPATARDLGVDPYDTSENFRGGAQYLRDMLARYDGDITLALAAYNAGPAAVDRYRGVPPYPETRAYVAAVLQRLSERVAP